MNMNSANHHPAPVRQPAAVDPARSQAAAPAGHPHGLMDAFHLPPSPAERRALRMAAERLVGPGGA